MCNLCAPAQSVAEAPLWDSFDPVFSGTVEFAHGTKLSEVFCGLWHLVREEFNHDPSSVRQMSTGGVTGNTATLTPTVC